MTDLGCDLALVYIRRRHTLGKGIYYVLQTLLRLSTPAELSRSAYSPAPQPLSALKLADGEVSFSGSMLEFFLMPMWKDSFSGLKGDILLFFPLLPSLLSFVVLR